MHENATSLVDILKRVEQIRIKHELAAKLTGENFNVFEILGLNACEVRTHSAFIAELLDPSGVHGQGDTFLRLFLGLEAIKSYLGDFGYGSVTVMVEHSIRAINEGITEGGRIDILLKDSKGMHLIIENKIYARDQPNQLQRYHDFDPQATLVYLTLMGEPSEETQLIDKKDYYCLSYSKDILSWLLECHRASVSLPVIRETVFQYANLVRRLTHQTSGQNMKDEIIQVITGHPELADAAALMGEAWVAIYNKTVEDCRTQMACINEPFDVDDHISVVRGCEASDKDDGVWIGFRAVYRCSPNQPADDVAHKYASKLKGADKPETMRIPEGKYWNIGIFNPKPFGLREGFESLPKSKIVSLYNDNQALKDMVDEIIGQADKVKMFLRQSISSL